MKKQLLVSLWLLMSSFTGVSAQIAAAITIESESKPLAGVSMQIKGARIGLQTQLAPTYHINAWANASSTSYIETLETTELSFMSDTCDPHEGYNSLATLIAIRLKLRHSRTNPF